MSPNAKPARGCTDSFRIPRHSVSEWFTGRGTARWGSRSLAPMPATTVIVTSIVLQAINFGIVASHHRLKPAALPVGKMTAVPPPHASFGPAHSCFEILQTPCLGARQLPCSLAVSYPLFLAMLSPINRLRGCRHGHAERRNSHESQNYTSHSFDLSIRCHGQRVSPAIGVNVQDRRLFQTCCRANTDCWQRATEAVRAHLRSRPDRSHSTQVRS